MAWPLVAAGAILGAIIGSFLNVVIARLPADEGSDLAAKEVGDLRVPFPGAVHDDPHLDGTRCGAAVGREKSYNFV